MAEKVISVNVILGADRGYFNEMEFPSVKAALDEGYQVKQVVSTTTAQGTSNLNLTFILSNDL